MNASAFQDLWAQATFWRVQFEKFQNITRKEADRSRRQSEQSRREARSKSKATPSLLFPYCSFYLNSRQWWARATPFPSHAQHVPITVNSRLADTSLLRTPRYYGQQLNPRRKLQTFDWNKLPLLRTLAITDLRTLYSVPTSQFYCFLSRYSGHRAASWKICTHIKSIFSAFLIHRGLGSLRLLMNLVSLATKWGKLQFKGEVHRAYWNDISRQCDSWCNQ